MEQLTEGNAAKLYCLNWIARYAADKTEVSILDLGSGRSGNFVKLLQQFPQVRYVGIEPSPADCDHARHATAGLNATIINGYAYDVQGRLVQEQFDLVTSFSVFEHVYRRVEYIKSIKSCLKPGGTCLINYDAGHFMSPASLRERVKNVVGPLLARMGRERYFQAFVPEADFQSMLSQVGLKVLEAKSFNTHLKGVYRHIPQPDRAEYMQRWLDMELWLNERGIVYDDPKARTWLTRNFLLEHAT
ncbi:MAG: class I SAM-dependent methyltransferase [Anaerolineae bacterium]